MIDALSILIVPLVVIVIFLALREVMAWYWKINKICDLLTRIEENTKKDTDNVTKQPLDPLK